MKTKNQARRNGGPKSSAKQGKTRSRKSLGKWQDLNEFEEETVTLLRDGIFYLAKDADKNLWVLRLGADENEINRIDYADASHWLMQQAQAIDPHTPESFLRLHGILPPAPTVKPALTGSDKAEIELELELAATQANGLLGMMADTMDYYSRSGCQFSGPSVEHLVSGICLLVADTRKKLEDAVNAALFPDVVKIPGQTGGAR